MYASLLVNTLVYRIYKCFTLHTYTNWSAHICTFPFILFGPSLLSFRPMSYNHCCYLATHSVLLGYYISEIELCSNILWSLHWKRHLCYPIKVCNAIVLRNSESQLFMSLLIFFLCNITHVDRYKGYIYAVTLYYYVNILRFRLYSCNYFRCI